MLNKSLIKPSHPLLLPNLLDGRKTEEVILEVNDLSTEIIESINEYEQELIEFNKTNSKSLDSFNKIVKELDKITRRTWTEEY